MKVPPDFNAMLKRELLAMAEEDNHVRADLVASGELFNGYHPRMAEVHKRNAARLDAIVKERGWPGKSLVGEDGTEAAWIVLQHAIGNPDVQRECLPLLKEAARAGEIDAAQVAYLEDRICVFEGRPQRFGTQIDWDETGQLNPLPLQHPELVDVYRESVGLCPLSLRLEQVRERARAEGEKPPQDFKRRQRESAAWAKSVGWL